jgi:hypothetical protein
MQIPFIINIIEPFTGHLFGLFCRRGASWLFLWICLMPGFSLFSQTSFYSVTDGQEIRIVMPQPNWRATLDSLMKSGDNATRLAGDVVINGQLNKGVGVRFKGFSSWNEGAAKNPFNIELDYFIKQKNYQGYKKIKLSNVIHDPSFLREVVSYHVARQYMHASQACYAMVYVNDSLQGLYTSVEDVDDLFMQNHFGNKNLPLIKGSPAKLVFPFGHNANLRFLHQTDSSAYYPFYALSSSYGWNDLTRLIDILNHRPEHLDSILNIDQALWMHAFNYALLNLDSYIGYAQNYYLGMDQHGRFNPILWDLNMSFGSFRSSDGSTGFQGLSIEQIKRLDPLQHLSFSISPRPLMSQLFADPTWRRMYLAHLRTIVEEQFESGVLIRLLDSLHQFIAPLVFADTHKFYSDADFISNLGVTVGGSGNMLAYVGLKELITTRTDYLKGYPGFTGHPEIMGVQAIPLRPAFGEEVTLRTSVAEANEVFLFHRSKTGAPFERLAMYDDGLHGDSLAGDGIWGVRVKIDGEVLQYGVYAQNDSAGAFFPARALAAYHTLYPLVRKGYLVFNEFRGMDLVSDANYHGSAPLWIELFHNGNDTLRTEGLTVRVNDLVQQFALPDVMMAPKSYLMLFPDGSNTSPFHPGFILDPTVRKVSLEYPDLYVVDEANCTSVSSHRTLGRYPNGIGCFAVMAPTPCARNARGIPLPNQLRISPNPARDIIYIDLTESGSFTIKIVGVTGTTCMEFTENSPDFSSERPVSVSFNISALTPGVYQVVVLSDHLVKSEKFIKW